MLWTFFKGSGLDFSENSKMSHIDVGSFHWNIANFVLHYSFFEICCAILWIFWREKSTLYSFQVFGLAAEPRIASVTDKPPMYLLHA